MITPRRVIARTRRSMFSVARLYHNAALADLRFRRVTTTTSTVGEQLKAELTQGKEEDLTSIIRERTVLQFDLASHPGPSIAILSLAADLAKAESSKAILQIRYYGQVEAISKEALAEYPENPPRAYLETVDQLTRKASADSTVLKSLNSNLLRMGVRGHELITVKNRVESDVIAATS